MRYSGLIKNDITAAPGLCVSFFTQGCPHHCPGCHNPETWDFNRGKEFTNDTLKEILEALTAQNIHRDLCIMGGEPLCQENAFLTRLIIQ
jgi:anaerobic ribonucleoside-triphosphate reductase activating protein